MSIAQMKIGASKTSFGLGDMPSSKRIPVQAIHMNFHNMDDSIIEACNKMAINETDV